MTLTNIAEVVWAVTTNPGHTAYWHKRAWMARSTNAYIYAAFRRAELRGLIRGKQAGHRTLYYAEEAR